MSKMNELWKVLWVQVARIGLKINVKKTNFLRLGISKDRKETLGKETIDQEVSCIYLGSVLVRTMGAVKMLKVE